jgi:predicted heme/steroid binding protein
MAPSTAEIMAAEPPQVYSLAEVAQHNTRDDLWVAVDGAVYDFSAPKGALFHPGGLPPLLEVAGTDATETFFGLHRTEVLQRPQFAKLKIGVLEGSPAALAAEDGTEEVVLAETSVPYGESLGFWRKSSPYYTQSHDVFRDAVREVYDREVAPFAEEWDEAGERCPPEVYKKLGETGIIASLVAGEDRGAQFLKKWGVELPGGVNPYEFDYFHALVGGEEAIRGCRGGYGLKDGMIGGVCAYFTSAPDLTRLPAPGCLPACHPCAGGHTGCRSAPIHYPIHNVARPSPMAVSDRLSDSCV